MVMVCPYCRTEVSPEGGGMFCASCGTPHHDECYQENGGCTLFGCKLAPADDPKVQITTSEVRQAGGAAVAAAPSPFGDVEAAGMPSAVAVLPQMAPPPPPPPPGTAVGRDGASPARRAEPVGGTIFAAPVAAPKARLVYILLGIFLGSFGAHNFYAGYVKRGFLQLGVTLLTFFYAAFVTWIWALVEVCTVDRDSRNIEFV